VKAAGVCHGCMHAPQVTWGKTWPYMGLHVDTMQWCSSSREGPHIVL
jgi:hypothetical protein